MEVSPTPPMRLLLQAAALALPYALGAQADSARTPSVQLRSGTLTRAWLESQARLRGAEHGRVGRVQWSTADSLRFRWSGGFDATTTAWGDVVRLDTLVRESRSMGHVLAGGALGGVAGVLVMIGAAAAGLRPRCSGDQCLGAAFLAITGSFSVGALAGGVIGYRIPARREWATVRGEAP